MAAPGAELGTYLVRYRNGTDAPARAAALRAKGYAVGHIYRHVFDGLSVQLPAAAATALARDRDVLTVVPDDLVRVSGTQTQPTWNLDRIDQTQPGSNGTYAYPASGSGVRVYVIDTGIRADHVDFAGRIQSGFDAVGDGRGTSDCHGHGTHVAGIAAGTTYGVAKTATLVPVRVLGCDGSGTWSGVIAGLDWVAAQHPDGAPAVANMSLGGSAYELVDVATDRLVADGVVVTVAAGNDNTDACTESPARAGSALTVAASDWTDTRPAFSNVGACVELFAPGDSIQSDYNSSSTATTAMSGTSMAAPHVAGAVAVAWSTMPGASAPTVSAVVQAGATRDVIRDPGEGSPNALLYIDNAWATAAGPPPAPTGVTVTAEDPGAIVVRLAAPSTGPAAQSYDVEYGTAPFAAGTGTMVHGATLANTVTVTGLLPTVSYWFRMRAVNYQGASQWSALTGPASPADRPGTVSGLAAVPGPGRAALSWSPASANGAPISRYELRWATRGDMSDAQVVTGDATTSTTLTGLDADATQYFQVRAVNAVGAGDWAPATPVGATTSASACVTSTLSATGGAQQIVVSGATACTDGTPRSVDLRYAPAADSTKAQTVRSVASSGSASATLGGASTARRWGGPGDDGATGIAVDRSGNRFVTGTFTGSITFGSQTLTSADAQDAFVAKLDREGAAVWAVGIRGPEPERTGTVALGPQGRVAVTGSFSGTVQIGSTTLTSAGGRDLYLAVLDASGAVVWARTVGGTGDDSGSAVAFGPDGSVSVAGQYQSATMTIGTATLTNADASSPYAMVASWDSTGTPRWAQSATGPWGVTGRAVAVDARGTTWLGGDFAAPTLHAGSVAVANVNAGRTDGYVLGYSPAGVPVSGQRIGGGGDDTVTALTVDPSGNVVLGGSFTSNTVRLGALSVESAGATDGFVAKLDLGATPVWLKRLGGTEDDRVISLATDDTGAVSLGATTRSDPVGVGGDALENRGPAGSLDGVVARLGPDGTWRFARTFGDTGDDRLAIVSVDPSAGPDGVISVTGTFASSGLVVGTSSLTNAGTGADIAVIATPLHSLRPGVAYNIQLRAVNDTGVGPWGPIPAATATPLAVPDPVGALTASGAKGAINLSWTAPSSPSAVTGYDLRWATRPDMVTGRRVRYGTTTGTPAPTTKTMDTTAVGGPTGSVTTGDASQYLEAYDVALDGAGNRVVAERDFFNGYAIVSKYAPDGTVIWRTRFTGLAYALHLTLDRSANVFVTGYFTGSDAAIGDFTFVNPNLNFAETYVAKLDASGNVQWAKVITGPGNETVGGIALDAGGNVYIDGTFTSATASVGTLKLVNVGAEDAYVAKFSPSGAPVWARAMGGANEDAANGIAVDRSGVVYLGGYYSSPSFAIGPKTLTLKGSFNVFVVRFDAAGTTLRADSYGDGAALGCDLALDASGNIVVSGISYGQSTFGNLAVGGFGGTDAIVLRIANDGSLSWVKAFGGDGYDYGYGVAVDPYGNIAVGGPFSSKSFAIGATTLTNADPYGEYSYDGFAASLSPTGTVRYVKHLTGTGTNDFVYNVAVDASGNAYAVGGFSSSTLRLPDGTANRIGQYDSFVTGALDAPAGPVSGMTYYFQARATSASGPAPDWGPVSPGSASAFAAPGPVDKLLGTASGAQVTLSWAAAYPNGAPVTGYEVRYATNAQMTNATTTPAATTSTSSPATTVLGLTESTTYYFQLRATNAGGTGEWAPPVPVSATTGTAPVGAVTTVSATRGVGQVALSWTAPRSTTTITSYHVRWWPASGTPSQASVASPATTGAPAPTSYTVTSLTNETAYAFQVMGCAAAGCGSWGPATPVVATPSGRPGAPGQPVAVRDGLGSLRVTTTAPSYIGTSVPTSYTFVSTADATKSCTASSPTTGCSITGLPASPGTSFVARATNVAGTGPDSTASAPVTAVVQQSYASVASVSSTATVTLGGGAAPVGARLVVYLAADSTAASKPSVSQVSFPNGGTASCTTTYTTVAGGSATAGSGIMGGIVSCAVTAALPSNGAVRITVSATTPRLVAVAEMYTGLSSGGTLTTWALTKGVTSAPTTATTSSLASGTLVLGAWFWENGTSTLTADSDTAGGQGWSPPMGAANAVAGTSGLSLQRQTKFVTASSTQTYNTVSATGSSQDWVGAILALR